MNIYAQKEKFKYVVAFAWNYGNLAPSSTICRDFVFFNNEISRSEDITRHARQHLNFMKSRQKFSNFYFVAVCKGFSRVWQSRYCRLYLSTTRRAIRVIIGLREIIRRIIHTWRILGLDKLPCNICSRSQKCTLAQKLRCVSARNSRYRIACEFCEPRDMMNSCNTACIMEKQRLCVSHDLELYARKPTKEELLHV